ncbi:MAG: VOC family protein, partial [Acidimicrobiales bacterium]|nr:VOC family protein [Acidimicrobiales bacterium]
MPLRTTAPTGAPIWIDLMTSDPDTTRPFYGELFGWTSVVGGEEYGGYINFLKDDVVVAGCMQNQPEFGSPDVWSVYLASDDATATGVTAEAHGGAVVVPVMDVLDLGRMAVVTDPGGASIGVWEPGVHPGFGVLDEPGT